MTSIKIQKFIQENAKYSGKIAMYKPKAAIQLVELLDKEGYKVFGVDGIFVLPQGYQPSMEDSIDISSQSAGQKSDLENMLTLNKFIEARQNIKDLFFEVVWNKPRS